MARHRTRKLQVQWANPGLRDGSGEETDASQQSWEGLEHAIHILPGALIHMLRSIKFSFNWCERDACSCLRPTLCTVRSYRE